MTNHPNRSQPIRSQFPEHSSPFTKQGLTSDGRLVSEGFSKSDFWIAAPEQFRTSNQDVVKIAVYSGTGSLYRIEDAVQIGK